MKARDQRPNKPNPAPVIAIERYLRSRKCRISHTTVGATDRIKRVKETAAEHLENHTTPPLGLAMVLLRGDGKFASLVEAIEPEQADLFADELERLARNLRQHPSKPSRQGGKTLVTTATALAFMAATYINQNALIDAGLSLAAQLTMTALSKRRP